MPSPPRPDVERLEAWLARNILESRITLARDELTALLTYLRAVEIENDTLKNVMPVEIARQRQTIIDLESDNASLIEQFEKDQALLRAVEGYLSLGVRADEATQQLRAVEGERDELFAQGLGLVNRLRQPPAPPDAAPLKCVNDWTIVDGDCPCHHQLSALLAAPAPPDAAAVERVARAIYDASAFEPNDQHFEMFKGAWLKTAEAALRAARAVHPSPKETP